MDKIMEYRKTFSAVVLNINKLFECKCLKLYLKLYH